MTLTFNEIIDLSVPLEPCQSERVPLSIRYVEHEEGAGEMSRIFGAKRKDLPESGGWAGEELRLISHAGTHIDAPWHYGPTTAGKAALSIDEVPLQWFFGPGVVIDVSHKAPDDDVTVIDLQTELRELDLTLTPGCIVLLHTGASRHWGTAKYPEYGAGLTREATLWLCRSGVRVIGTDAFSLDAPFEVMRDRFSKTHDPRVIWPAHFAGLDAPYSQIEKLNNLDLLPRSPFWVCCFPVKIARASAGWTRAVALVP